MMDKYAAIVPLMHPQYRNRTYFITQVATCAVSKPHDADCQDEQDDAADNTVRRTCMNDLGSSRFLTDALFHARFKVATRVIPILCVLRASVVTKVTTSVNNQSVRMTAIPVLCVRAAPAAGEDWESAAAW